LTFTKEHGEGVGSWENAKKNCEGAEKKQNAKKSRRNAVGGWDCSTVNRKTKPDGVVATQTFTRGRPWGPAPHSREKEEGRGNTKAQLTEEFPHDNIKLK